MDFRLFDARNAAPGTAILAFAGWLTEQFIGAQSWLSHVPLGWLALISFAFWFGYDAYHPEGRLRTWLRSATSLGRFGEAYNQSLDYDLGANHGGKQRFIDVFVPFTFRRHATIDAIRLTSVIHSFPGIIVEPPRATYTWKAFENARHHAGDTIDIPIAYIPEDVNHPGVYGDLDLAGYYLTAGSAHLITIEIFIRRSPEIHRVLILLPTARVYARLSERSGDVNPGGRFLVFQEGQRLFSKAAA